MTSAQTTLIFNWSPDQKHDQVYSLVKIKE